jgi:signal transduction histidine kinase
MYLIVVGLGVVLNLAFPGMWGSVGIYNLCVVVFYRCPLRWALPLAGVCILALATTYGALQFLPITLLQPANIGSAIFNLFLACMLCWFGWILRTQYLLVVKLHEVQKKLKEQVVRNEELATERERTRIARDIHDVLSHSLAVLSIQVQAARHLIVREPERVATKLDDMAVLIRESITESRRVIGLLRDKAPVLSDTEGLGASLQALATTFNERTGINCRFEERGAPHRITFQQRETLRQALREILTNAHRHGAARTIEIVLQWREASLLLVAHDDGMGVNALPQGTHVQEMDDETSGHHGLQGMRERVTALGGDVEARPGETGGFTVMLQLPFETFDK